jgi:hypothetical protein
MHIVPIEMQYQVLLYFSMHVMYCALRVGSCIDVRTACCTLPYLSLYLEVIIFID